MNLWVYRDFSDWHTRLAPLALSRGHDVEVFSEANEPDEGTVFARIHHYPQVRERDKAVMAALALKPALHLVPGARAAVLYDDKAEQARQLARWMPQTAIVDRLEDAPAALARLGLPLMSKTSEGAGSHNVRFVTTRKQAMLEATSAFGAGMPVYMDQVQCGYLLWQKFMQRNAYDFRVIAIGRERLILRRGNRKDRPMASGSGREMPISWPDREASEVLDFANSFFAEERMTFCGIDVVRDHEASRWVLLECTTGWPIGKMHLHTFVSGRPGSEYWKIVMDELEAGACH
jgi:glutathione synthase/RimK-type ligase-like ATP-grasp enzyme